MKAFTEHPEAVGETYFTHLMTSFSFGTKMVTAGIGCFLHGLFPFLCVKTGSATITTLHHSMVTHRDKRSEPCESADRSVA